MERLMDFLRRLRNVDLPPPPPIDQMAVRERMKATDPDFRRVSGVQHDALQVVGGQAIADGLSIRRERSFWERAPRGGQEHE